jgi:hypothetical protein
MNNAYDVLMMGIPKRNYNITTRITLFFFESVVGIGV